MNPVELYERAIGRTPPDSKSPEELEEIAAAIEVAQIERENWLSNKISQVFLQGLEDKAKEYTERAGEQSTPFGDKKLCSYFMSLSVTLRKVITYARTGKYSD